MEQNQHRETNCNQNIDLPYYKFTDNNINCYQLIICNLKYLNVSIFNMVMQWIVIFNLDWMWFVVGGLICFELDTTDLKHFVKNYLHY